MADQKADEKKVSEKKAPEKGPVKNESKPVKACQDEMGKHKKFDKFK